ncbi:hypothetical protein CONCODRAFT_10970 [Conidiobolus coronatus NRRL 28638]|uniref:G-protein coupled receptors family 1 profile domain-containing protein n=1 Tax=Conidiobolus coronatus (strain ATCC 28846 / CBS 209.66 / NRRL 28638) TaxID=796925 RepID=A0A137NWN8_CONC2|nr:hypothetical protein CONCODRAFT_10970 [Conidiobolus coronatus NRRL 28638]|eukprot:KXN67049.1 hypothetical protein CONCODRAFT_10970 [Conidiobolus coronatus NRRL 28638]
MPIFTIPSVALIIIYSFVFYTNDASPLASKLYCSPFAKQGNLSGVMLYLIPFFYIIPCWITTYCYFMVGWIANKKLNLMKQEAVDSSNESLLISIKKQKLKLWMQILFVFYIYNANFCLSYVTWIMRLASNYKRPILMDAIVYLQVTSTSFLNPIVTIIFQPDINHESKILWIKLKLKIEKLFH